MDALPVLKTIAKEVDKDVKRSYWGEERMLKDYARRPANKILRDGDTPFLGNCPDLTSTAAAKAVEKGLTDITLVVKELYNNKYDRAGLHFALQFNRNDYHLDFYKDNIVHLGRGPYDPLEDPDAELQALHLIRQPFDPDKNLLENYGEALPHIGEPHLALITNSLLPYCTEDHYERYTKRHQGNGSFIIQERL